VQEVFLTPNRIRRNQGRP